MSWIGVVAEVGDAGQDVLGELVERADLRLLLRHADVRFVDAQARRVSRRAAGS